MSELYFDIKIAGNRQLCIAPLTDSQLAAAEIPEEESHGYFLFERVLNGNREELEVLAHVASRDAADRLRLLLQMR